MSLFQKSVEKKYLNDLDTALIDKKYADFLNHFGNPEIQENIRNSKEEQYQGEFLIDLFVNILGYTKNPTPNFNLTTELKNIANSKKADGAILKGDDATAVIELKGTNTTDLDKIETQAFGYKNHHPKCKYVITSNFEKLRFYIQNAVDHVDFDLFNLTREQFSLLWLCLAKDNLLSDLPLKIKESSVLQEENITKKLYADYSKFREAIYTNLVKNNPDTDKLLLFKKTQKLLDRFLFIFFAEDRLLLPPNSISEIVKQWADLKEKYDEYFPLYSRFKKYFGYMNTGYNGKKYDIYAYNGGLFKPDEVLDNITIDDDILYEHTLRLSNYDFETDVDVNILGHIFEHSLGEIENVQAEIKGEKIDSQKTKRKKDGIFYTPKYITKYIVENTVGKLCDEKRTELVIVDEEYAKGRKNRKKEIVRTLDKKLDDYRNWLLTLTILDPACGSGAFLNQALEFLINEHRKIDELRGQLLGGAIIFSDITTDILEKNIYGVDLNEESVEIAKLSLWLRTAQKGRKLNTLSNNIKCGNSLIDDPEVAGEKAFNWQNEFPEIFKNGGFDVVIRNPPYVPTEYISELDKIFLERNYQSAFGRINLFPIFYEKGLSVLKQNGILSYITPYTILKNQYYKEARKYILENYSLIILVDFKGVTVFEDAAVDSIILVLEKQISDGNKYTSIFNIKNFPSNLFETATFLQKDILKSNDLSFNISVFDKLIERISKNCKPLKEIVDFNQGIITGGNKKFITTIKNELTKKVITGSDFNRYSITPSSNLIIYDTEKLHRPRKKEIFEAKAKILLRQTGSYPICAIDTDRYYTLDTVHNGLLIDSEFDLKYLVCLLNSKLFRFLYENSINETGKVFAQVKIIYIDPLPIKTANKETQQPFINFATTIIEKSSELSILNSRISNLIMSKFELEKLSKNLQNWFDLEFKDFLKELKKENVKLSLSKEAEWMQYFNEQKEKAQSIKTEIEKNDKEIDRMIYELYGLTEEEIKIVEGE